MTCFCIFFIVLIAVFCALCTIADAMSDSQSLEPLGWFHPAKKYNGGDFKFPIYKVLQKEEKSQRAKLSFLTFQPTETGTCNTQLIHTFGDMHTYCLLLGVKVKIWSKLSRILPVDLRRTILPTQNPYSTYNVKWTNSVDVGLNTSDPGVHTQKKWRKCGKMSRTLCLQCAKNDDSNANVKDKRPASRFGSYQHPRQAWCRPHVLECK